jgi:hypothetical protein
MFADPMASSKQCSGEAVCAGWWHDQLHKESFTPTADSLCADNAFAAEIASTGNGCGKSIRA